MRKILPLFFLLLSLVSCQKESKTKLSFYYWKTSFLLSAKEKQLLQDYRVNKLYLRYFDIDLHPKTAQAYPVSAIHFEKKANDFQIIPVVYIKNKVLQSEGNIQNLAFKTVDFIKQINQKNAISISEIQIDCDWTNSTQEKYFQFIEELKHISKKKVSATIRLHQIKYFKKTGIPKVDYGVLMYYNMGEIGANSKNSIYDSEIAARYLPSLKNYPLQLNVALPIFSWAIHSRNGKVIGLRNKINWQKYATNSHFVTTPENQLEVTQTFYKEGILYRTGDRLKQEFITDKMLLQMADELAENLKNKPKELIIYDLDDFNFTPYENSIFEDLLTSF